MGGRSRAAAQLLSGQGFHTVYNLKGGMKGWQGLSAAGPWEAGMVYLEGDETAEEVVLLAYGMEEGLRGFYHSLADQAGDSGLEAILTKLEETEEKHKEKLFNLYVELDSSVKQREVFESKVLPKAMEGGVTEKEFLEKNRPALESPEGILDMAMMLETQALDLYLRYAQESKDRKARTIFYRIADEEKGHLATLGRFLEVRFA